MKKTDFEYLSTQEKILPSTNVTSDDFEKHSCDLSFFSLADLLKLSIENESILSELCVFEIYHNKTRLTILALLSLHFASPGR